MESLMRYISRTSRLSVLYRGARLEKYQLNGLHHTYILNICRNPGITQEKLAKLIFINKSNVARQLAVLEEQGYVTRAEDSNDRRQMLVYPTEKAEQVYPIIQGILNDWNTAILKDFSAEEQELLVRSMEKIMNRAKSVVDLLEEESTQ